jgi:hypothetical protein
MQRIAMAFKYNKNKNGVMSVGSIKNLEFQIEEQRSRMYEAFRENSNHDDIIRLSQDLDRLLNKLEKMKKMNA